MQLFSQLNSKIFAILIYLLTNSLFVLKYGERQDFLPISILIIGYNLLIVLGLYGIHYFKDNLNTIKKGNAIFLILIVAVFLVFLAINFAIDGNTLNSDRWSAMEVTIASILEGEYPYAIKDHLGKTSSNLPGLFYIGLPFYFLGSVGFLQPAVFLIIGIFIYKLKLQVHVKTILVFLMIASPAYLWEIFAKSDLVSNIILLVLFMYLWHLKFKDNYFKKTSLLSFFCALLLLTRGVVVIPLTLFLFYPFLKQATFIKIKFVLLILFFVLLLSSPVLLNLPDFATIAAHNPFNHQTRFTPKWMQIIFVLLPFFMIWKKQKMQTIISYGFVLLSLLLYGSFIMEISDEGFKDSLFKSYFDISYLTMILPFAIPVIAYSHKN